MNRIKNSPIISKINPVKIIKVPSTRGTLNLFCRMETNGFNRKDKMIANKNGYKYGKLYFKR